MVNQVILLESVAFDLVVGTGAQVLDTAEVQAMGIVQEGEGPQDVAACLHTHVVVRRHIAVALLMLTGIGAGAGAESLHATYFASLRMSGTSLLDLKVLHELCQTPVILSVSLIVGFFKVVISAHRSLGLLRNSPPCLLAHRRG